MDKLSRSAIVGAVLTLALALAACGNTGPTPGMPGMDHGGNSSSPSGMAHPEVDAADSMFVMMMIPHHEQAIEMSDMILAENDVDQAVLDLARQIKAAQAPEITLMKSWLKEWGMPSTGGMEGMDHGGGMMSDDDMAALEAASGSDAARLYLEQMIEHHQGAIDMAQDELDDGANADVLALAEQIVTSQTAEIARMEELLGDI